jgi:hypothetical protein
MSNRMKASNRVIRPFIGEKLSKVLLVRFLSNINY